jgi:hypothetical protein
MIARFAALIIAALAITSSGVTRRSSIARNSQEQWRQRIEAISFGRPHAHVSLTVWLGIGSVLCTLDVGGFKNRLASVLA